MTKTDIDRLRQVVQSENNPRGAGKTFAHCHELAGVLSVTKDSVVLCRIETMERLWHIKPMMKQVFVEYGIEFNRFCGYGMMEYNVPDSGRKIVLFARFDDEEALFGRDCPVVDFHD